MPGPGYQGTRFQNKPPKAASGAFYFFLEEFRSEVKRSKNVAIESKEIVKMCTERWNKMKERDKKKYKIMSMADHKRANYERKIYQMRLKERKIEITKPKNSRSAQMWYIQANAPLLKEENPNLKSGEHLKILNQQFKYLSDDEKRPYVEMEEKDRERKKEEVQKIKQKERERKKQINVMRKSKKVSKKKATEVPYGKITSREYVSDSETESDHEDGQGPENK